MSDVQTLSLRLGAGHHDRLERFTLPANWTLTTCPPTGGNVLSEQQVQRVFERPVGMAPIREVARGASSAVILVDDFRRPTPAEWLCNVVIDELTAAGVSADQISIILGNGAHRVMNRREMLRRLGGVVERVGQVLSHDAFSDDVTFLGITAAGTPVLINRIAVDADFSVSISTAYPHVLTGWGGGAKMVLPGVAHVSSCYCHHTRIAAGEWGENPGQSRARRDIEEAAAMFGLDAAVVAVINPNKELCGLRVGEPTRAHRSAVRLARRMYHTQLPEKKADLVIANAYPMDGDPTQLGKTEIPARHCGAPILIVIDFADPCDWHGVYHGPRQPYVRKPAAPMPERTQALLEAAEVFVYCPQAADGYVPAKRNWYCDHDWDRLIAAMRKRFAKPNVFVLPAAPLQIPTRAGRT